MLKVAVSACLLGEQIRYDKTGQRDRFITDKLGKYASFIPFCPEHLAFGTPRETIRIVLENEQKKVITVFSKADVTEAMNRAMAHELEKIKKEELCGIILKSKSPSCGLGSTKYYMKEMSEGKKDGLFASLCKEHFEDFPIEEEARLLDPWLRENFVMQLFAYADTIEQQAKTAKARVDNLTQAILAKAFRGELTADWRAANPDLISGDNSAAALLARIQAERATAKPRKRATKTSAT